MDSRTINGGNDSTPRLKSPRMSNGRKETDRECHRVPVLGFLLYIYCLLFQPLANPRYLSFQKSLRLYRNPTAPCRQGDHYEQSITMLGERFRLASNGRIVLLLVLIGLRVFNLVSSAAVGESSVLLCDPRSG